jgi:N-acylneuraminate cytidylyltransferase
MSDVLVDLVKLYQLEASLLVLLQPTSPLRIKQDIDAAINLYKASCYDVVMSVTKADSSTLKFGFCDDGRFQSISKPEYSFSNRQSLPALFRPNGAVYVFNGDWLIANNGLSTDNVGVIEMPDVRSFDIDTQADFDQALAIHLSENSYKDDRA